MPRAGTITRPGGKRIDSYETSRCSRSRSRSCLRTSRPRPSGGMARSGPRAHGGLYPPRAVTHDRGWWNRPVRVKWINDLKDGDGNFLPHLLPVDPTLHRANLPEGRRPRHAADVRVDARPVHGPGPDRDAPARFLGVGDESDGYAEAWFLPAADDIPEGFATEGTWFEFFAGKASSKYGVSWGPGFATFQYPNDQRASTLWYHDHTLGMTRLNVYAGPAGFFIIRGGPEGDKAVVDDRTGTTAVLLARRREKVTSSLRTRNTEIRTRSRIARSTRTARSSTPTRGRSSTASRARTSRSRTSRRSGTRSFSGTRSW